MRKLCQGATVVLGNNKKKPSYQSYQNQVLKICFDDESVEKFSPGLKMIYSSGESPLFIKVEKLKKRSAKAVHSLVG